MINLKVSLKKKNSAVVDLFWYFQSKVVRKILSNSSDCVVWVIIGEPSLNGLTLIYPTPEGQGSLTAVWGRFFSQGVKW